MCGKINGVCGCSGGCTPPNDSEQLHTWLATARALMLPVVNCRQALLYEHTHKHVQSTRCYIYTHYITKSSLIGLGAGHCCVNITFCQYKSICDATQFIVQLNPTNVAIWSTSPWKISDTIGYSYKCERLSECTRVDLEGHENPKFSCGACPQTL